MDGGRRQAGLWSAVNGGYEFYYLDIWRIFSPVLSCAGRDSVKRIFPVKVEIFVISRPNEFDKAYRNNSLPAFGLFGIHEQTSSELVASLSPERATDTQPDRQPKRTIPLAFGAGTRRGTNKL